MVRIKAVTPAQQTGGRCTPNKKIIWQFALRDENIYTVQHNSFKKTGVNDEFKKY
jgi:hypothetical protein